MNVLLKISLSVALSALPSLAGAWTARNYHKVAPVSDTVFEVVGRAGSGGQEFWCAAGDYSRRVLGASVTQRVYLVRGPAPAQTQNWNRAVLFSLVPPVGVDPGTSLFLSLKRVGDNLSASAAQQYCQRDLVTRP